MRRIAAVLTVLVAAATSQQDESSATTYGFQDDPTVVRGDFDRQLAFEQLIRKGGQNIRININHLDGAAKSPLDLEAGATKLPLKLYDSAIQAVVDAGLKPQVTLVWNYQSNAEDFAAWSRSVVRRYKDQVDTWSILNEPDLTLPAPDDCDPALISRMVTEGTLTTVLVKRKVKRYIRVKRHGKWRYRYHWVRIKRLSHGKVVRKWVRHKRYRLVWKQVPVVVSGNVQRTEEVVSLARGCLATQRGRMYRRFFNATEPLIRQTDDGAIVLAGETSPLPGLDLFVKAALPLHADGWAHHAYQWFDPPEQSTGGYGIGDLDRVHQLVMMPIWVTEFGYARPGSAFAEFRAPSNWTEERYADWLNRAALEARRRGVREFLQYNWFSPHKDWGGSWNTAIQAAADGSEALAYRAFTAFEP